MTALLTVAFWLAQAVPDAAVPELVTDTDNQLVVLIGGLIIPLVTALVMRIDASSTFKGLATASLAFGLAVFQAWQDGGPLWTAELVVDAVTAWVIAVVSYVSVWRSKVAPTIAHAVPGGLGGGGAPPPPRG